MTNYETSLTKINNIMFPMIERQLEGHGMEMDEYSRSCVLNAISAINNALEGAGVSWNNPQLDQGNVTQILLSVASLKLNPSAHPNEVYFQVRNVKVPQVDENGKKRDIWKKQIEMGIEGDGNDAILSRFGRGVREVRNHWLVREQDGFEYPTYNGLEMSPPKWQPTGKGKVVRVVYPIIKESGAVEFHISEREDVIKNLVAHVKNNMMNETFGIAESRFKANSSQKAEIDKRKDEIVKRVEELGLDGALDDEELRKYISPAWKEPQSRESMIIRKMRNNIVKKIPKDFGHVLSEIQYEKTTNDYDAQVEQEIREQANRETIDIVADDEVEDGPYENPPKETATIHPEDAKEEEKPVDDVPEGQQTIEEVMEELEREKKTDEGKIPF